MNVEQLQGLDEDEFADELNEHLGFQDDTWNLFLDHRLARRTGEALEELELKAEMQLRKHEAEIGDVHDDWERRTKNWQSLVGHRLRQVRRIIQSMDGNVRARESAWKAFAHDLCDALEDSDLDSALDDIDAPFGDLSAREWRDRRVEKDGARAKVLHVLDGLAA